MAVEIQMPQMGESVTEGTVLEWHVAEGDQVEEGETVVEVSTDKVDAEVPAPADGTITKLLVEVDDEVKVGAALAELEPGSNGASAGSASADRRRPGRPGPEAEEAAGSDCRLARSASNADSARSERDRPPRMTPASAPARRPPRARSRW